MSTKFLWATVCLALVCGAIALATWNIPAPAVQVTKKFPLTHFTQKRNP